MKFLLCALVLSGSAFADDMTCFKVGNQLHCHTERQIEQPRNTFDPSVISHIADETNSQRQMLCVTQAARAGMDRQTIVMLCFH